MNYNKHITKHSINHNDIKNCIERLSIIHGKPDDWRLCKNELDRDHDVSLIKLCRKMLRELSPIEIYKLCKGEV